MNIYQVYDLDFYRVLVLIFIINYNQEVDLHMKFTCNYFASV